MRSDREPGTVIVTGAGSGIGFALTRRLLDEGYAVSAWDIAAGELRQLSSPSLACVEVDVSDREAVLRAAEAALGMGGPLVGLAACAAVFKPAPFLELDERMWDDTFAVNLAGTLYCCQAVLPAMREQGAGSIVLFSSAIARTGAVNGAHYAAAKGGVLGLMRSLALETAAGGIRVNAVSPGITDTPQPRGHSTEEAIQIRARTIPLGRIGLPEEMAEAAMFLLGGDSSFVTGQELRVKGGSLMF